MSFSRRDRAALALALECLRAGDDYDASSALFAGAHEETCSAIRLAFLDAGFSTPNRILCARLALALRVLLRVDAGDFGRCRTWVCDQEHQPCWLETHRAYEPVRPLWCDAPPHEVSR